MPLRTLRVARISVSNLRPEIAYSASQCKAHQLTQSYVPVFEGFLSEWEGIHNTWLGLLDLIAAAEARSDAVDVRIAHLVSRIFKAAMVITHDERDHALVVRYFDKESTVKQIQRLGLDKKLARVRTWVKSLKESEHPSLAALGVELEALVTEADLAIASKSAAEDKKKDFNEIGDRKKFVDRLNAARKLTYGELAKLAHETVGLPSNFADLFFRHESHAKDDEDEPLTLDEAKAEVAAAEAELEARKKVVEEIETKEAQDAEVTKKIAAEKALLADLEKSAEEILKKVEQQRAKLKATRPGGTPLKL